MANPTPSQQWPPYPHIPIYLETTDGSGATRSYNTISPISPMPRAPEIRSQGRAVHALAAASTQFTNLSTNISPVSPATQFTNLSPIWPIPEPPPQRPALRFFPSGRPRIQLDNGLHKEKQQPVRDSRSKADLNGLGILNRPSSLAMSQIIETSESQPNIAQRIEQRLWRYTTSRNVVKRWLLEIISWWISAICMATIIGVLIYYRDGKLPDWPGVLTLNAFIAILSKISGAALILPVSEALGQLKWSWFQGDSKKMWDFEIFDNASRGPWGSVLLLIRTKGKALAALGALITIFSMALDPFFQQVVDFPERWTLLGNSSIPNVVVYKPRFGIEFLAGNELNQQDQDIAAIAQKFLYDNGTQPLQFGNGTRPDIPLSCPTSNCTWPLYDTLGVCSACTDVSELLTFACLNTTVDWAANSSGAYLEYTYPNARMCGYFLNATSDTPILMSGYLADSANSSEATGEILLMRAFPLISNPRREAFYGGSYKFKHVRNPIADFFIVSAANGSDSVLRHQVPVTHECMLTWCVKSINSSYSFATYNEEVKHEFINDTAGPSPWFSKQFQSAELNGTEAYYQQNVIIDPPGYNASTVRVSNTTAMYTIQIFDDFLPSWTTVANASADSIMRFKFALNKSPNWIKPIFNPWLAPNNVTSHMERLATALTNTIRSSNSSEPVLGKAYRTQAYVSVRWVWLILPISLLFLSLVFLVSTIIKTGRGAAKVGVWKTSAIATLLYGLPDDMQEKITSSADKDPKARTPRAKAKQLKVKLLPTKGWRVSGNLFSPMMPKVNQNQAPPGWV
jgi:hypothetical protein